MIIIGLAWCSPGVQGGPRFKMVLEREETIKQKQRSPAEDHAPRIGALGTTAMLWADMDASHVIQSNEER